MGEYYHDNKDILAQVNYHLPPVGIGEDWNFNDDEGFYANFGMGYQASMMLDRMDVPDEFHVDFEPDCPEAFENAQIQAVVDWNMESWPKPLLVAIDHTYDEKTRAVNIDVTATFSGAVDGDMRFYVVLTEARVQSDLPGYEQGGWKEAEPFVYERVAKYMPGGFFGVPGTIPASATNGDEYTENFSFDLPEIASEHVQDLVPIDPEAVFIVASVVTSGEAGNRPSLATNNANLIPPKASDTGAPSPAKIRVDAVEKDATLTIDVTTKQTTAFDITLYDYRGNPISTTPQKAYAPGTYQSQIATADLKPGTYFIKVRTEEKDYTKRLRISGK